MHVSRLRKVGNFAEDTSMSYGSPRPGHDEAESEYHDTVWKWVSTILTNLGPMSLEQMHQRLSMFLQPYEWTAEQLLRLLKRRTRDDLLEHHSGKFKLKST
jgi:hypothetical protein